MAHENNDPRSISVRIGALVVTHGCVYHPDSSRWEPKASVRGPGVADGLVTLVSKEAQFQDTPEDAMAVAQTMLDSWIDAEEPSLPVDIQTHPNSADPAGMQPGIDSAAISGVRQPS